MPQGSVSVVIPTGDAAFLPGLLASIDAQVGGLAGVELILVAGPAGSSADVAQAWAARSGADVRLIRCSDAGSAAARNAGLDAARGEWVTFWDPRDALDPRYLAETRPFLGSPEAEGVHLVAGRVVPVARPGEADGERGTHALDYRFRNGNRVIGLERHPYLFQIAATAAFYRRAVLVDGGLRFGDEAAAGFEEGYLTGRYLGSFDRPKIALRADACYLARRGEPGAYPGHEIPARGWLALLRALTAERGAAPRWAQNLIVHEIHEWFRAERKLPSRTGWVTPEMATRFHDTLAEVAEHLDAEVIESAGYPPGRIHVDLVSALLIGVKGLRARPPHVSADHVEERQHLARLRYFFGGAPPAEEFRARGLVVEPRHGKIRRIDFLGRTMAQERIAWLAATDTLSLSLDGRPVPMVVGPLANVRYHASPARMWWTLANQEPPASRAKRPAAEGAGLRRRAGNLAGSLADGARELVPDDIGDLRRQAEDAATRRLAASPWARRRYGDAWLLIDRDTQAGDNAEHLYRYLQGEQPHVNAHFVLGRDSEDWDRLAADGFRLIEHGSRRHTMALLNARHLISSQADAYITHPLDRDRFGAGDWRYTFLQHGVTKDDLSVWINPKPISLMLASTHDEQDSIAGDGSAYNFTTREIVLTGMPRHDRLRRLGEAERDGRRTVLVTPTWRLGLLGGRTAGGNDRELRADFWDTSYARAWRDLLTAPELHAAAEAHGARVVFVPHPNMQNYVRGNPLPAHVEVLRFADTDIQSLIARCAVLVTDYSSLAFDAAYIDRPVVYHQFDQAEFFSGAHVYRPGSWRYAEDGFGPVRVDTAGAVAEIVRLLAAGGVPDPVYAQRIAETFQLRDGQCCRRAYDAILALDRPPPRADIYSYPKPSR